MGTHRSWLTDPGKLTFLIGVVGETVQQPEERSDIFDLSSLGQKYPLERSDSPDGYPFVAADSGKEFPVIRLSLSPGDSAQWRTDEKDLSSTAHCRLAHTGLRQDGGATEVILVGDVNLFHDGAAQLFDTQTSEEEDARGPITEIDVMVALKAVRCRGLAREAVQLVMSYARHELLMRSSATVESNPKFRAKILEKNRGSLRLFESMSFRTTHRAAAFQEIW